MKGNKLVITFILALIVCLVLIPTCAFAEGTEPLGNEASSENAGNPPAQPSVETSGVTPDEPPVGTSGETPAQPSVETSGETPDEPSVETSGETPAQPSVETSDEPSVETPDEPSVETPDEPSVEPSDEPTAGTSGETPAAPPVETPSEPPAETPAAPGYTVEFTVGEKQYVLAGDSSVDLSEIMDSLGISGEISEASSSADSLFSVAKDENGKWTVSANKCFSSTQSMTVVVDGQEYQIVVTDNGVVASYVDANGEIQSSTSLKDAIANAADGTTVVLKEDTKESIVITSGKTVTIDLGGKTLTNEDGQHTITVNKDAKLIITDSVGGGVVDNVSHRKGALVNYGHVDLNGGTFTRSAEADNDPDNPNGNSYYTICNYSGANMVINDGVTVLNKGHFSSMIHNYGATLTINGGTFSGGINTVKNEGHEDYLDQGILTINGGTFTNTTQAAVLNWNRTEINGGTFDSSADAAILNGTTPWASGELNKGQVTINGGSFTSSGSSNIKDFIYSNNGYDAFVDVNGGTFSKDPMKFVDADDNTVVSAGDSFAVGSEGNMASVNGLMANAGDNTITVYSAPKGITAPEGSTVVNRTGSPITVNGVVLQPDQSITIPVSPVAVRGDYYIIEGKDQTWTKGSNEELSFKLNSGKLIKVLIDGEEVEFEITEDGLVTIAPEVLEALEPGVHTITFVFVDGGISTNIVIEA